MATKIASLYAEIGADTTKLEAGLKNTKTGLKDAETGTSQLKSALSGMANAAAGAFAVNKIVDFAKQSVTAASDLNETVSKSKVVFGDASKAVESMGAQAATSMGMSKNAAIGAAATYGNLFVSMGLAKDQSADMSVNIVKLAGDLASFNNIPVDQALEKLRAGLTGESEPLKTLGININEAMLKQEALNLKLWDGNGVLDAATKAQAAYSLMLKQTATAQGDFARTADGAANQMRIAQAQADNLSATLGQKLLPVWIEVLKVGNSAATTLTTLIDFDKQIVEAETEHEAAMRKTSKSYTEYITEMQRAAAAAGLLIDAQGNLIQQQDNGMGASTQKVIVTNFAASESLYNVAQKAKFAADEYSLLNQQAKKAAEDGIIAMKYALEKATVSMFDFSTSEAGVKLKTDQLKAAQDALSKSFSTTLSGGMAIADANKTYAKSYDAIQNTIEKLKTDIQVMGTYTPFTEEQSAKVNKYWSALQLAKKATEDMLNTSSKAGPAALSTLNAAIAKLTGGPASFKSAGDAAKYLQDKVNELSAGHYLTDEQKKELEDAKTKLGEQQSALDELTKQHTIDTNKMIFNMLLQKAASDGLTKTEFDNLMKVGVGMGILTEKDATMASNLNAINLDQADNELKTIEDRIRAIMGLPDSKTINVTTNYFSNNSTPGTGTPGYYDPSTDPTLNGFARGADFIVPSRYQNDSFPMRVSAGEHVQVTPAADVKAGKTNQPITVNFYGITDYDEITRRIFEVANRRAAR